MKKRVLQKLIGAGLIACGVVAAVFTKDLTLSIVVVPLGLFAVITKQDILN